MEDGENLKVKAILEYEDGITLNNRLVFYYKQQKSFLFIFFSVNVKAWYLLS